MIRVTLLAAAAATSGCTAVPVENPLAGTSWVLQSVWEGERETYPSQDDLDAADRAALAFDAVERGVRVRSCNSCAGLYTVGDRTLEITRLACTRMACPGRLELDRYVAGRSRWTIREGQLVLTVNDSINGIDAVLTFDPAPAGGD